MGERRRTITRNYTRIPIQCYSRPFAGVGILKDYFFLNLSITKTERRPSTLIEGDRNEGGPSVFTENDTSFCDPRLLRFCPSKKRRTYLGIRD